MSGPGPLDHPALREIDAHLDAGRLNEAQRALAALGHDTRLTHGVAYLATRLLLLRGRLDPAGVSERLRDLLRAAPNFPEAQTLLREQTGGDASAAGGDETKTPSLPSRRLPAVAPELSPVRPERAVGEGPDRGGADGDGVRAPELITADPFAPRVGVGPHAAELVVPDPFGAASPTGAQDLPDPPARPQGSGLGSAVESLEALDPPPLSTLSGPEPARDPGQPAPDRPMTPPTEQVLAGSPAMGRRATLRGLVALRDVGSNPLAEALLEVADSVNDQAAEKGASRAGAAGLPDPHQDPVSLSESQGEAWVSSAGLSGQVEEGSHRLTLSQERRLLSPKFPRAAPVPRFTPPPDLAPSYVPPIRIKVSSGSLGVAPASTSEAMIAGPGLYSERPENAQEIVWSLEPDESKHLEGLAAEPAPALEQAACPPAEPRPTVFEIATLLGDAKYSEALTRLDAIGDAEGPDIILLRARALAGAERNEEARHTLLRFGAAPLLDPDLRAEGARLLLSLGAIEPALEQARIAAADAPDNSWVRLTRAWAALRLARRIGDRSLIREAEEALRGQRTRSGPDPGLLLALRAAVEAQGGDPERAVTLAQRALNHDPGSLDGLAALALGSARIHRPHDAKQAWRRLRAVAPEEAAIIRAELEPLVSDLDSLNPLGSGPFCSLEAAREVWHPIEMALVERRLDEVLIHFEERCRDQLDQLAARDGEPSFQEIAGMAVEVLSTDPVCCSFAPFDLSLWSLDRVRALLDMLYDRSNPERTDPDDFPVILLLGSYAGQVFTRVFSAEWEGSIEHLLEARVVSDSTHWWPFQALSLRITAQKELVWGSTSGYSRSHPGGDGNTTQCESFHPPPMPWSTGLWPEPDRIEVLGRALAHSVIGEFCARQAGAPLDGSIASLSALDQYLTLIAPSAARYDETPVWAPRIAVLVGAYLGEVLRNTAGGLWSSPAGAPLGPDAYRLLVGATEHTPVAQVFSRLTGRILTPLSEYAIRIVGA